MAHLVAAIGVPHTPAFPALVEQEGDKSETATLYSKLRAEIEESKPDLVVMFDTDHLNTFFFDSLPIFAIGVAERFTGPNDDVPKLPPRSIRSNVAFSRHLRRKAIEAGFDMVLAEEFTADHSVIVPLHFLTPQMNIPVVPIFIGGHVPPLPSARRCFELGRSTRKAIDGWPEPLRVIVLGSGSFSLDVYGPRIDIGSSYGVPDPAWSERVAMLLRAGDVDLLINEASSEKLQQAGNVGGELLNWIAMLGAWGAGKPEWLTLQPQFGHGYGLWRLRI
jgi:gallate dioxygenase